MKVQFSYPMASDGSGRLGRPSQQYVLLSSVPREGEEIIIDGLSYRARHVVWYPFGDLHEEILEPMVYISLRLS